MPARERLDQHLVSLGLTASREQARRLIMAGEVTVNGQRADRPADPVRPGDVVALKAKPRYVSRGGDKLHAALEAFAVPVAGAVCADVGASTGGFTDCLLQHGAAKVYAIDVGKGILDYKLRTDPRVVVLEDTNARYLAALPEPIHLAVVDVSFISLKILLPVVCGWGAAQVVALIKPQFEAGREAVAKGAGVIRDPAIHQQVVADIQAFAATLGLTSAGLIPSPLLGPKGNTEFLLWLRAGL